MSARLVLCGFGLRLSELTLETLDALRSADVVYTDGLDPASSRSLAPSCRELRCLRPEGEGRGSAPEPELLAPVLDSLSAGQRVAFLRYGHPTFLASLSETLLAECRKRGFEYRVLNAVSSLDAVLAGLELTAVGTGLQVFDAYDLCEPGSPGPNPRLPCVILKPGRLAAAGRLHGFLSRLRPLYPPGHAVVLVECASLRAAQQRRDSTLETLEPLLADGAVYATLYVPPRPRG